MTVNVVFTTLAYSITVFHVERPVFLRETAGGYYGVLPFFLAKCLFEVLIISVHCIICVLAGYWLIGWHANPFLLIAETILMAMASGSLSFVLSAIAAQKDAAAALGPVCTIPQLIFSGVLIPIQYIPSTLRWLRWICPLYYGIGLIGASEFQHIFEEESTCEHVLRCPVLAMQISFLKSQDVSPDRINLNIGMSFLLIVFYRLLALLILYRKSRFVM